MIAISSSDVRMPKPPCCHWPPNLKSLDPGRTAAGDGRNHPGEDSARPGQRCERRCASDAASVQTPATHDDLVLPVAESGVEVAHGCVLGPDHHVELRCAAVPDPAFASDASSPRRTRASQRRAGPRGSRPSRDDRRDRSSPWQSACRRPSRPEQSSQLPRSRVQCRFEDRSKGLGVRLVPTARALLESALLRGGGLQLTRRRAGRIVGDSA